MKPQATENKRMHSIALRISRGFLLRLVFTLLAVNVLLAASALALSAYSLEKAALGDAWQADLRRGISVQGELPLMQKIASLEYSFALGDGEIHRVPIGPALRTAAWALAGLLAGEAILVVLQHRGSKRRVQRLMAPLRQMAQAAQEFSQARFDEAKFHTLEDAIDRLSVQSPNARLATGDSELSGLEEAVNKLINRMHEAYRQQIRFVSDASHELRTPIAVIRGYADLLTRWGKEDRKVMDESVKAIRDEADNMQRLVEGLLFLARGDAGRTPFTPVRVNLDELAAEAFEEYNLICKDHLWRNRSEGGVPAWGDEAMLKQALRVLADNAVKFSPPGSVITLRAYLDDQGMACLSVQDNGAGIPAADLPHVFERFYRSDPARVKGGAGLGLSIAKWIVDRHGGHIDIFSSEGVGTRFTLILPPAKETKETEAAPAAIALK